MVRAFLWPSSASSPVARLLGSTSFSASCSCFAFARSWTQGAPLDLKNAGCEATADSLAARTPAMEHAREPAGTARCAPQSEWCARGAPFAAACRTWCRRLPEVVRGRRSSTHPQFHRQKPALGERVPHALGGPLDEVLRAQRTRSVRTGDCAARSATAQGVCALGPEQWARCPEAGRN